MCASSVISDYYQNTYPNRFNPVSPATYMPALPQTVVHQFDAETKDMLRQALKLLDKIDKKLGDVECMDDAKKAFLATLGLNPEDIGG
jgi:hypothetical protein